MNIEFIEFLVESLFIIHLLGILLVTIFFAFPRKIKKIRKPSKLDILFFRNEIFFKKLIEQIEQKKVTSKRNKKIKKKKVTFKKQKKSKDKNYLKNIEQKLLKIKKIIKDL